MSHQPTTEKPKRPLTEKQLAARRLNAQKSTGPRTPEGKARSSQNARKHGFFTQTALLFYEAPEDFVALRDSYIDEYQPQTPTEMHCVMEMANAQFRLRRVRGLEADLFQILITRELPSRSLSNGEMQAQAFRTLADTSNALHLLQRYEVMFRRQYERALRMLWEHRDRQRELASQTTPRRRKRNTFPDSPPLTPTDLPLPLRSDFPSALAEGCIPTVPPDSPSPSPSDFPSALAEGCIPTVPPDSPSPSHPDFPPALAGGCIPTVPDSLSNSPGGCIPTVPPPAPQTIAPQHPPTPQTAILRNEPKPAPARVRTGQPARLQPRAQSPAGPERGCNPLRVQIRKRKPRSARQ
jgi:hypothetical protein